MVSCLLLNFRIYHIYIDFCCLIITNRLILLCYLWNLLFCLLLIIEFRNLSVLFCFNRRINFAHNSTFWFYKLGWIYRFFYINQKAEKTRFTHRIFKILRWIQVLSKTSFRQMNYSILKKISILMIKIFIINQGNHLKKTNIINLITDEKIYLF